MSYDSPSSPRRPEPRKDPQAENQPSESSNDVAVIGMACRVAGGISTLDHLWQALLDKKDASGPLPASRWEAYETKDPQTARALNGVTKRGYFVEDIYDFDCQFFGISPKEAEQMDPQQRMSLEIACEALEDAGIPTDSLKGSDTAVVWGVGPCDYANLVLRDLPGIEAWMGIGTSQCGVPNRISYHLDLAGPSVALDGACASSLMAVHYGAKAIIDGDAKMAIVGGVNAVCSPSLTRMLDTAGTLSPDGRCRSLDNGANGYARGEGAGAVILKRLKEARRDRDRVYAVIKGSAVSHNGKTNGIMHPNPIAQEMVARKALKVAGMEPESITYVEAHATATRVGDPAEISAIAAVYGAGRTGSNPCYIGSIKPNIGHLEAGAGIMGFIKSCMILHNKVIPPQANLETLNTAVKWEGTGLQAVQQRTLWPDTGIARAAVCSYGYGGAVSHAVLEEPLHSSPAPVGSNSSGDAGKLHMLLLSAPEEARLGQVATSLSEWLGEQASPDFAGICTTLATRRTHHPARACAIVSDVAEAKDALDSIGNRVEHASVIQDKTLDPGVGREPVWVFSGHGAQWTDMGKDLIRNAIFMRAIRPLDMIVRGEIGLSPIEWLHEGDMASSDRVQILTYIVQIGISAVLIDQGVFPRAVVGHSVGEIAATVIAGGISAEEGTIIVTRRAVLYRPLMGTGGMLVVQRSYEEVGRDLQSKAQVSVAIDSSPCSCVVSGPKEEISALRSNYEARGVKTFAVNADIAFHSRMLDSIENPLRAALEDVVTPVSPSIKLYSTSCSDPRTQDLRNPQYWVSNTLRPVLLTSAIRAAIDDGYRIFVEISSHPIVSHSLEEIIMDRGVQRYAVIPTLQKQQPLDRCMLHAIGAIHCKGAAIDWKAQNSGPWRSDIPKTRWVHRTLLHKSTDSTIYHHDIKAHSLVGHQMDIGGTDIVLYSTTLDMNSKPYPEPHPILGSEIVPVSCLINTLLRAGASRTLTDIVLKTPVAISHERRTVQVATDGGQVRIMSRVAEQTEPGSQHGWVTHTTAHTTAHTIHSDTTEASEVIPEEQHRGSRLADNFAIDYLTKWGATAMAFPWSVTEQYWDGERMLARVQIPADDDWDPSSWAPFMDAATSIGSSIFYTEPELRLPAQINHVDVATDLDPPKSGWIFVRQNSSSQFTCDVNVTTDDGTMVARFTGMRFSGIQGASDTGQIGGLVHRICWPPVRHAEVPMVIDKVALLSVDRERGTRYAKTVPGHVCTVHLSSVAEMDEDASLCAGQGTAIVYIPEPIHGFEEVPPSAERFVWQLLEIVKWTVRKAPGAKLFVLTMHTAEASTPTALAHAPLIGLSRILASEHPEHFGGLIDCEDEGIPWSTMKYVQESDIIRIWDGVARTAKLRSLNGCSPQDPAKCLPRPHGTYIITGGLGILGLEVADFLADNGARRLVLVSRRSLPPRRTWEGAESDGYGRVCSRILELEKRGVSVHVLVIDVASGRATQDLVTKLDALGLPPVLGVVHAAGVLEAQLAMDTTRSALSRVLAPKVQGALALHAAFPPKSLDFFIVFSSCGQLIGTPGQSYYAPANSFLDALVTHRRNMGDNSITFQWSQWRGMGMGSDNEVGRAEFESRGITDITRDEAFQAWLHLSRYDVDHGVILRCRTVDEEGEPPLPILADIAVRRVGQAVPLAGETGAHQPSSQNKRSLSGSELSAYIEDRIRSAVAGVLHFASPDEVGADVPLSQVGLDSVMAVGLRRELRKALDVAVPPTLFWEYETVGRLVPWFFKKLGAQLEK